MKNGNCSMHAQEAGLAVRRRRESQKLSQKQLAVRIKTASRESPKSNEQASDVSLDQILRAFAAVGGRIAVKQVVADCQGHGAKRPGQMGRKKIKVVDEAEVAELSIELIGSD